MENAPSSMGSFTLSQQDVDNLLKSSLEKRVDITQKIAAIYSMGGFSQEHMKIADELFRVLVKDTETEVRRILSQTVKESKDLPNDVANMLARDISEIALPVLECSKVLTDADLVEIIESTQDATKQIAISKRDNISEFISSALIETRNSQVVDSLLCNETVQLSEKNYAHIIDNFGNDRDIVKTMIDREALPVSVVEHLAQTISSTLFERVAQKHQGFSGSNQMVEAVSDVAIMKVMGMQGTDKDYKQFLDLMNRLQVQDDLIPISALCMGNINLFEVRMARMLKIPVLNIRKLMEDNSNLGFKALYQKARLPNNLLMVSSLLVSVLREMKHAIDLSEKLCVSNELTHKIIERLEQKVSEQVDRVDNVDYIISLLKHNEVINKD